MPESATVARRRPSRSNDPDASRKRPASAQSAEMVASKRIAAAVPRYLAFLEYDGARFRGFQRQCGVAATVQGALDEALTAFTGARGAIECVGSSRTDVGVHALRNSAHFDCARTTKDGTTVEPHDGASVRRGVNYHLKKLGAAVRVTECVRVDLVNPKFHARHDAVARRYRYDILVGERDDGGSLFDAERAWYVRAVSKGERGDKVRSARRYQTCDGRLNVDAMRDAAAALTGTHDFSSFRANGCQASSPVRTVTSIDVKERAHGVARRGGARDEAKDFHRRRRAQFSVPSSPSPRRRAQSRRRARPHRERRSGASRSERRRARAANGARARVIFGRRRVSRKLRRASRVRRARRRRVTS